MQHKAPTKCGKSIGTREERWALGGNKVKKQHKTLKNSKWRQ